MTCDSDFVSVECIDVECIDADCIDVECSDADCLYVEYRCRVYWFIDVELSYRLVQFFIHTLCCADLLEKKS